MWSFTRIVAVGIGAAVVAALASAAHGSVLFDFENATIHTSLPATLTVSGITAHFSATGQGMSFQTPSSTIGVTPTGFSGICIAPNSVFASDLLVSFDQTLTDFSILYAPQELATGSSATMRVTAFMNSTSVGTNTMVASPPGTWPSATLAISVPAGFNNVVVHYASPPPTGGDYGVIFVADNMNVTAAVPEPGALGLLAAGSLALLSKSKRPTRGL